MTRWYRRTRLALVALWLAMGVWTLKHWSAPNLTRSAVRMAPLNLTKRYRVPADSVTEQLDEFLQRITFDDARALKTESTISSATADSVQLQRNALQLLLTGVVDGAVSQAIIDGLPGVQTAYTMRLGDQYGAVRLVEVHREHVVLNINGRRTALLIARPAVVNP